ncbi:hypothetical protein F5Y08DRAFT_230942 [Xylaria arbuscula]|nr:hypothetical protein F5Y08DRAFT_230942 [Xylaria arbuscula]
MHWLQRCSGSTTWTRLHTHSSLENPLSAIQRGGVFPAWYVLGLFCGCILESPSLPCSVVRLSALEPSKSRLSKPGPLHSHSWKKKSKTSRPILNEQGPGRFHPGKSIRLRNSWHVKEGWRYSPSMWIGNSKLTIDILTKAISWARRKTRYPKT